MKRFASLGILAAVLLTLTGCPGGAEVNPFKRGSDYKAECLQRGDLWICRDSSEQVCKLPNSLQCEDEAQCPDCTCKCFTPPSRR